MDVPEFTKDGPELLWVQVVDWITAQVESGRLKPGERLAPERELADELGVSYMTVRRAMKELRERGVVVSVQGRGTFIRRDVG